MMGTTMIYIMVRSCLENGAYYDGEWKNGLKHGRCTRHKI